MTQDQDTLAPLTEAFDTVRLWLDGKSDALPPASRADLVARTFELDIFSRNVLLLAAYAALEPDAGERLLLGTGVPQPTATTALTRLPGANWAALAPDAPLRRLRLLDWIGGELPAQTLILAEPVLFFLLGAPCLSEEVAARLRPVVPQERLSPARRRLAEALSRHLHADPARCLSIGGGDADGKALSLATACATIGQTLWHMPAAMLPASADDQLRLAPSLLRDLHLCGGRLLITLDGEASEAASLRRLGALAPLPLALCAADVPDVPGLIVHRLEMPRQSTAEQADVWRGSMGPIAGRLNGGVDRLAQAFPVPPETAETVVADIEARIDPKAAPVAEIERLAWDATRRAARPRLDDLAQRIRGTACWDDLIVPDRARDTLRELVAQVRNRARVYEDWAFGRRLQGRGLGISALFHGPSGAGKTLAGEVIAGELGLDLYRIDLSSMVSKWIGETEKNLRRVFDAAEEGGVILQFDEADALFGKRSEVREAHDRHANIEVSYLLQRLEAYRGLTILTTNLRDNIDEAFLRRLRFIVEFRFPSVAERRAIWRRILPAPVPREGLDYDCLARLNVPGGVIRNIALGATFLAAEEDGPVTMERLRRAARTDYEKSGRIMTDAELNGWPG